MAYLASDRAIELVFSAADTVLQVADRRWISRWVSMV